MSEWPVDELAARRARLAAHKRVSRAVTPHMSYEQSEVMAYAQAVRDTERAPLSDRQVARDEFFKAMRDEPDVVAERIAWMISGDFGYGAKIAAERVLAGRGNKLAQLTHMIGALAWQCPPSMAVAAWKKLTKAQQVRLDAEIGRVL